MARLGVLLALLGALGGHARAQEASLPVGLTRIGAAGAVHGLVQASAPQAVGRVIESGKELYLNDHVTTDAAGRLQVLLLDQTVFTLGPNADMVLDEFVYDPNTNAGKVTARIAKGAFRFVTGEVARAHPQNFKVKLAVGTIGVRGTVVTGETGPEGSTVINAGAGPDNDADEKPSAILVTNDGVTRVVDTTGEGVTIAPAQPPSIPQDMTLQIDHYSDVVAPPPKVQQPATNDPMQGDPVQASGELVAVAKTYSINSQQQQQQSTGYSQQSSQASQVQTQSTDLGNVSVWDEMIANLSGQASYIFNGQVGSFTQTMMGGSPVSIAGTWDYELDVDFNAHTIGGFAQIDTTGETGNISDESSVSQSFGTSGQATFTMPNASNAGSYTFTFQNGNGQIAGQVTGTAAYKDATGNAGSGGPSIAPKGPYSGGG